MELKPCPFCGGEAEVSYGYTFGAEYQYQPNCTKCYCSLGIYDSEEEAIEAWNRRTDNETD